MQVSLNPFVGIQEIVRYGQSAMSRLTSRPQFLDIFTSKKPTHRGETKPLAPKNNVSWVSQHPYLSAVGALSLAACIATLVTRQLLQENVPPPASRSLVIADPLSTCIRTNDYSDPFSCFEGIEKGASCKDISTQVNTLKETLCRARFRGDGKTMGILKRRFSTSCPMGDMRIPQLFEALGGNFQTHLTRADPLADCNELLTVLYPKSKWGAA